MRIGDTVGDYRILEELGRGGEGRVFKVEHVITRRKEAMKVLSGAALVEQDMAHRFLREIRVQASLNHPRIAAVHNAFWIGNELMMVMELVEGAPLSDILLKGQVGWRRGVEIVCQVLAALDHAHTAGVVHRDVAPANIVVQPGGDIKLTDFGLAWTAADMRMTRSGTFMGSVQYMSPEQVRGADKADHRSDIYSCGVVLYETVTGSRPFYSENAFQLMRAHVEQLPAPPIERNPAIPPELNRAVLRALAKEPRERFATAREFLDELERVLEGTPVVVPVKPTRPVNAVAPPPPAGETVKSTAAGFWVGSSWAAGLVAGILLVGLTSYGGLRFNWETEASETDTSGFVPATLPAFEPPTELPATDDAAAPEEVQETAPAPAQRARKPAPEPVRQFVPPPQVYGAEIVKPAPAAEKLLPEIPPLLSPPPRVPAPKAAAPAPAAEFASAPYLQQPETPAKAEDKGNGLVRALGKVKLLNPFRRRAGQQVPVRETTQGEN